MVWYQGSGTTNRSFLFADVRGSIVAVTSGAGTTPNKYDVYGAPSPGYQGRFLYTGQMWLSELGLYHYKARAYSPAFGRFMQTDPIGYEAGMNLYAYVENDPVNFTDPSGLCMACAVPVGLFQQVTNLAHQTALSQTAFASLGLALSARELDLQTEERFLRTLVTWDFGREVGLKAARSDGNAMAGLANWAWGAAGELGGCFLDPGCAYTMLGPVGALTSRAALPARSVGEKTAGVLQYGLGNKIPIQSGKAGFAAAVPAGTRGFNGLVKTHVEGHAVAFMRMNGVNKATLYINNAPCAGLVGCAAMLPRMLPPGAQLRVVGPNGYNQIFTGIK